MTESVDVRHSSFRSPVPAGHSLEGKYRVEREIGAGAMGVVVEAWHVELGQRVAIKFLSPGLAHNEEVAERFRREARALASIESEHVAKVLDIGMLGELRTPYYVMEYLRGRDLAKELAERGPLPVGVAVHYVLEACEALAQAHRNGIVHRDLKPANLFLAERANGSRCIKVLDFGISKVISPELRPFSLTDTATMMGSPAYMSPEQIESARNVDGRADIWSLGVILHELLLDELPFRGESVLQLVRAILGGKRSSLTSRRDVPAQLEEIVARCLQQDREERFESVERLSEALRPFELAYLSSPAHWAEGPRHAPQSLPPDAVISVMDGVTPVSVDHPAASSPGSLPPPPAPEAAAPEPHPHTRSAPISWGTTLLGPWRTGYRKGALLLSLVAVVAAGGYLSLRWWLAPDGPRAAKDGLAASTLPLEAAPPGEPAAPLQATPAATTTPAEASRAAPGEPAAAAAEHPTVSVVPAPAPAARGAAPAARPGVTPSTGAVRRSGAAPVRPPTESVGGTRSSPPPAAAARPSFDWGGRE